MHRFESGAPVKRPVNIRAGAHALLRIGPIWRERLDRPVYAVTLWPNQSLTRRGHRLDSETWRTMRSFADHVTATWRDPDAGIWERRDAPRHHVHSKLMAWLALDRATRIAREREAEGGVDELRAADAGQGDRLHGHGQVVAEGGPGGEVHEPGLGRRIADHLGQETVSARCGGPDDEAAVRARKHARESAAVLSDQDHEGALEGTGGLPLVDGAHDGLGADRRGAEDEEESEPADDAHGGVVRGIRGKLARGRRGVEGGSPRVDDGVRSVTFPAP